MNDPVRGTSRTLLGLNGVIDKYASYNIDSDLEACPRPIDCGHITAASDDWNRQPRIPGHALAMSAESPVAGFLLRINAAPIQRLFIFRNDNGKPCGR